MSVAVALKIPDSHYNPNSGRFLTADPIGFNSGDTNFYRNTFNNPIRYNDPDGLKVSQCKRPLDGINFMAGPLNHTFLCVNGYCNGQTAQNTDAKSTAFGGPGKPSNDGTMGSDGSISGSGAGAVCTEKKAPKDKQKCFDSCVKNTISSSNRPTYAIGPFGTDCQEYASETINNCMSRCQ